LLLDGSLLCSSLDNRLHTYSAEIDLEEVDFSFLKIPDTLEMRPYRHYGLPHLHLGPRMVIADIDPASFEESKPLRLMCSPFSRPHYTLKGLYDSLPNERMHTRIDALKDELARRNGYSFESIVTSGKTKLKLLENLYRRKVSS
jgi:hypothetical protein